MDDSMLQDLCYRGLSCKSFFYTLCLMILTYLILFIVYFGNERYDFFLFSYFYVLFFISYNYFFILRNLLEIFFIYFMFNDFDVFNFIYCIFLKRTICIFFIFLLLCNICHFL